MAKPLNVGKHWSELLTAQGKSYHYFQGVKDQILTAEVKGTSTGTWKMLDYKGREMADWAGTVTVEEDGEQCLEVSGRRDMRLRSRRPRGTAARPGRRQENLRSASARGDERVGVFPASRVISA